MTTYKGNGHAGGYRVNFKKMDRWHFEKDINNDEWILYKNGKEFKTKDKDNDR